MLCDSHIHVGQFYDIYTPPRRLLSIARQIGIDRMAVSSTTICEEDYTKVLREMKTLLRCGKDKVLPVLWITPMMVDNPFVIDEFINSGISWRCVKIHGALHPYVWKPYSRYMKKAVAVAQQLGVPLLFHTGSFPYCEPDYYRKVIARYKRQTFILAHSRPVNQTIAIMHEYKNVWADTAFAPIDDIKLMVDAGLTDRMMWGSDLPIMQHFYGEPNVEYDFATYYKRQIEELRTILCDDEYTKLTSANFNRLFYTINNIKN